MIIKNFSKALYSSWHYYAPDRILFDCGEGAALHLKQEIFAVQKIVLSHGHIDHISGLLSFLCLRQSTKGDTEKPLDIYYPEGDRSIGIMIKAANEMFK
ncbi:MAG: MBL fold metallo-hydrolase, partial [Lentisphaeria bacterium]|nr:MBL fold metallo-hydrolase [Lentisphaeria bacterium]NQZ66459.1 MBL fold metallo-hydrolase [Lentisphaeria bacterium]